MSEGEDEPSESRERPASESADRPAEAARSVEQASWYDDIDWGRQVAFPLLTLVCLLVIFVAFSKILLPFVFACAIVYLMEPVVVRLSRTPEDPRGLPRWITVILVYLAFFGVVTGAGALIMPRLVGEVARFAETVPENVQTFRSEKLPGLNKQVQGYLGMIDPAETAAGGVERAKGEVRRAWRGASATASALGAAKLHVRRGADAGFEWEFEQGGVRRRSMVPGMSTAVAERRIAEVGGHGEWRQRSDTPPAFRVEPTGGGGLDVYLEGSGVEVAEVGEKRWRLEPASERDQGEGGSLDLRSRFDLEQRLNQMLEDVVTFSAEQMAALIEFLQHLIFGILEAFIAIILTLMVAAFISIDLPRFMAFFRSLVPEQLRSGYGEMLERIDRGLAGVIRGQLIICVINGILTYVGLVIFEVKYGVLLASIAGVLSIIPVFGTVVSTIPICLVALAQSFTTALLVLGWILLIHFIEGNILNPKIIGTSAEIHPVIVIFALLAGESTYGLVGAVLAVPVASILLSLFKFARDKMWEEEGGGVGRGTGTSEA